MEKNVFPSCWTMRRQRKPDKQKGWFSREHVSRRRLNHLVLRQWRQGSRLIHPTGFSSARRLCHLCSDFPSDVRIKAVCDTEKSPFVTAVGVHKLKRFSAVTPLAFVLLLYWAPRSQTAVRPRQVVSWFILPAFAIDPFTYLLHCAWTHSAVQIRPPVLFVFRAFLLIRQSMLTEQLFFFLSQNICALFPPKIYKCYVF